MLYANIFKDRRLWLLVASGVVAFLLGFVLVKGPTALLCVSSGGYWMVLLAFVIWLCALWQCYGASIKALTFKGLDFKVNALIASCGTLLLTHEGIGFKILMDEILLVSTSMNMHISRQALISSRGNDIYGSFALLDGALDKRPLFQPFLVSLIHDFTGYRPENVFILNGVLVFIFLLLVAQLGRLLLGRVGAVLGVLLFTGLPLLGQNASGGGFELLNMVMAVSLLLLSVRWAEKRDEASLTAMCFAAVLLVQIRYESVLLAAPVPLLVAWVWFKEKRVILDWRVIIAPLFLVTYALHYQVFSLSPEAYQLASKPQYDKPFSLSYISENIGHAANFYFSKPSDQPNSLMFSILGWLLMPLAILTLFRWLKCWRSLDSKQVTILVFFGGFALHFLFMMAYFWGQFDDIVIRRLSLPSHLWLLLAVLLALGLWKPAEKVYWWLCGVAALFVLSVAVPSMSAHTYFQLYTPMRETEWRSDFVKKFPARDYLVVDNDASFWVINKVSATTVVAASKGLDAMSYHLKNRSFSNMYVYQHYVIDEKTGVATVRQDDDMGPDFELVPVSERRFNMFLISRMSRIVSIRNGANVQKATEPPGDAKPIVDQEELQKRRLEYMENYIKRLP